MSFRTSIISGLLVLILAFSRESVAQQGADSSLVNVCIDEESLTLFNLVNEYRKVLQLPSLSLSAGLTAVAQAHIRDLQLHRPDTGICNEHSWSGKGSWTPCCYDHRKPDRDCMMEKPFEISSYPGKGYELIYMENSDVVASTVFEYWRTLPPAKAFLTNMKEWEKFKWKAAGVAVSGGLAVIWLGEADDPAEGVEVCGTGRIITNNRSQAARDTVLSEQTGRFYLIIASLSSPEDARKQALELRSNGYPQAKVILKDGKYKVSIADYHTMGKAREAKASLPEDYREAWIMAF